MVKLRQPKHQIVTSKPPFKRQNRNFMTKSTDTVANNTAKPSGLERLIKTLNQQPGQKAAPVHLWDPPYCGELDMVIKSDGSWHYDGTPIGRQKLVALFATVLKREGDDFFLVTPVEKIGITVEDAPFIAIAMERKGEGEEQLLTLTSNVGDTVLAGADNALRFAPEPDGESVKPYVHIRAGLEARLSRAVYYELANLAVEATVDGAKQFGVWSNGEFFPLDTGAA